MIKVPQRKGKIIEIVQRGFYLFARAKLIIFVGGAIIGGVVTIAGQAFTGFWDFRKENAQIIRMQYESALNAQAKLESEIQKIEDIIESKNNHVSNLVFRATAQDLVRQIQNVSDRLPESKKELEQYVSAIADLSPYFSSNVPLMSREEKLVFYGRFRRDFNKYVITRDAYFSAITDQSSSYLRYLWGS